MSFTPADIKDKFKEMSSGSEGKKIVNNNTLVETFNGISIFSGIILLMYSIFKKNVILGVLASGIIFGASYLISLIQKDLNNIAEHYNTNGRYPDLTEYKKNTNFRIYWSLSVCIIAFVIIVYSIAFNKDTKDAKKINNEKNFVENDNTKEQVQQPNPVLKNILNEVNKKDKKGKEKSKIKNRRNGKYKKVTRKKKAKNKTANNNKPKSEFLDAVEKVQKSYDSINKDFKTIYDIQLEKLNKRQKFYNAPENELLGQFGNYGTKPLTMNDLNNYNAFKRGEAKNPFPKPTLQQQQDYYNNTRQQQQPANAGTTYSKNYPDLWSDYDFRLETPRGPKKAKNPVQIDKRPVGSNFTRNGQEVYRSYDSKLRNLKGEKVNSRGKPVTKPKESKVSVSPYML